jgi:aspartyl-tRNA(Asn)/glutamyl-tRNA(Gln) amidotransferase subunit A
MNDGLAFCSITDLSDKLQSGEVNSLQLVELFASRIDHFENESKAFISLDLDSAMDSARAFKYSPAQALGGIPYACKDLFDVQGQVTTGGSRVLEHEVAESNATVIDRINSAGGIYLGKNNLHEFAYGATGENSLYGTCPNPYDSSCLAGGSSSGSATAVGYGLCTAALGTDTGGSVRAPAALCGLVGFKPTYGRVSTEGVVPYSWTLDHVGSITRTAADAAILFSILRDSPSPIKTKTSPTLKGLTVGIPEAFFFEHADPEILDSIDKLMQFLTSSGAKLSKVPMPSMEYTRTVSLTVQMPEALSYHNRYLETRGELYSQAFRAGLALGQNILAEQYVRAKRFIETYRRDTDVVFREVDLLLTPATPAIAPKIGVVEVVTDGISEPAGNAITRYTSFFNMTGHPAITFPCGIHSSGLPIAAQLVGRHFEDEVLLDISARIENQLDFKLPPPVLPRAATERTGN